jgi:hypothetical protein
MVRLSVAESCYFMIDEMQEDVWQEFKNFLCRIKADPWNPGIPVTISEKDERIAAFSSDLEVSWRVGCAQEQTTLTDLEIQILAIRRRRE